MASLQHLVAQNMMLRVFIDIASYVCGNARNKEEGLWNN
jgi:hypothetical protein